jgi:hypothetical protein
VDACQGVNHLGEPAKGRKGDDPLSKLEQLACRLRGNLMSLLRLYRKMREEGADAEQAEETEEAPAQNEPTSEPPKSGISDLKSQIPQSGAGTAPEMQNEPKPGERGSGQDVNGCAAPGGSGTVLSELRDREAAG